MRTITTLLLTLLSTSALATPTTVHHQGRMFDALGDALTGTHDVDFAIYDVSSGGSAVWSESASLDFDNGYFATQLGNTTALDDTIFDGGDRWLGVTVNSGVEMRIEIDAVPYAIFSETATNLEGGTINADSIMVNGTSVIDTSGNYVGDISYSQISDPPADPFASLGCTDGDHLRLMSGAWACGQDTDLVITAGQLTGTIDINNLPVGGNSTDVAAGDHNHDISSLTGVATVGQLPVGDTASHVAAGNHSHGGAGPDGSSTANAASSCEQLLNDHPGTASGAYYINTIDQGDTSKARRTQCEMDVIGGGWTQFMQCMASDNCRANGNTLYNINWLGGNEEGYSATDSWLASGSLRPLLTGATEFLLEVENGAGDKGYISFRIDDKTRDFIWLPGSTHSQMNLVQATIVDSDGSVRRDNDLRLCWDNGDGSHMARAIQGSNNWTFLGVTSTAPNNNANTNCDFGAWTSQMLLRDLGNSMSANFGSPSSGDWDAQEYSHRLYIK